MIWQDAALEVAGVIGCSVAVLHGVLVQRLMVRPIETLAFADRRVGRPVRRLIPGLLHFSTFNWFVGGLALIAAGSGVAPNARMAIAMLVGSSYLYGALGNLWATGARHPGWALYAVALALIVYGADRSGA